MPSKLTINTPVNLSVISRIARSSAFCNLVAWAVYEGLEVKWETAKDADDKSLITGPDSEFEKLSLARWSADYQGRQLELATPPVVRMVSGEFNLMSWNKVSLDAWETIAKTFDAQEGESNQYSDFSMYGLCAPYVAVSKDSTGNKMVDFLIDTHSKSDASGRSFVNLHRCETRLPCHWVAIGDRISITDWHMPMAGPSTDRDAYATTVYAEGPGVADFAKKAFDKVCDEVLDVALHYRYNFDMLDPEVRESLPERYRPRVDTDSMILPVADRTETKVLSDVQGDRDADGFIPAGGGYFYADKETIDASYAQECAWKEEQSAFSTMCRLI